MTSTSTLKVIDRATVIKSPPEELGLMGFGWWGDDLCGETVTYAAGSPEGYDMNEELEGLEIRQKCERCPRVFYTQDSYDDHWLRSHVGE